MRSVSGRKWSVAESFASRKDLCSFSQAVNRPEDETFAAASSKVRTSAANSGGNMLVLLRDGDERMVESQDALGTAGMDAESAAVWRGRKLSSCACEFWDALEIRQ